MLHKSCSTLHQESNKIWFALFRFSMISYGIYKFQQNSNTIGDPVLRVGPWKFPSSHMPLVCNLALGNNETFAIGSLGRWPARLAGIRRLWRRSRSGKGAGRRASSPRVDPQPELGGRGVPVRVRGGARRRRPRELLLRGVGARPGQCPSAGAPLKAREGG
jgi:hypothetical protein